MLQSIPEFDLARRHQSCLLVPCDTVKLLQKEWQAKYGGGASWRTCNDAVALKMIYAHPACQLGRNRFKVQSRCHANPSWFISLRIQAH